MNSPTIINILKARKTNGLYSSIIIGRRGIGKSSYAIQTLFQVFRTLGYDKEESWEMALDRVLYTIPDVVKFLDNSRNKKDLDIFIWDDAGVYAGGVRWFTHQKEMVLLESISDTLRNMVYGVLLTVPDIRTLSRRLRSYDDFIIKIYMSQNNNGKEPVDPNIRQARIYNKSMTPVGQVRIYKQYNDNFDIMLPDWVYKKYQDKRRSYGGQELKHLKKMVND